MINKIILKIKRRETPFHSFLYRAIKACRSFNIPVIKVIHLPLYYLHFSLTLATKRLIDTFWSTPLFKARCERAGKHLSLPDGIPFVTGSHLKMYIGDNVTIFQTNIGASKIFDECVLRIGDNSVVAFGAFISVSKEITIGTNCMIGPYCMIMDSDDHPISPQKRLAKEGVEEKDVSPVRIGNNVWVGAYSTILKGVTIGDNSIIAAHSFVSKDVLANCVYAGYPARPTLRDIDKL